MAMPWTRAKQIAGGLRAEVPFPEGYDGSRTLEELTALFDACFRIAREIGCPIVLENVKGAQPWVGRANAHYGSYYLWGDVGNVGGRVVRADRPAKFGEYARANLRSVKNSETQGGTWFNIAHGERVPGNTDGAVKGMSGLHGLSHPDGNGGRDLGGPNDPRRFNSKSDSRKAASAMIAEIPFPLAEHIARVFKP
jgi:hypothetical protein